MNPYSRTSAVRVAWWCGAAFLLLFGGLGGGYFLIFSMIQDIKNVEDKLTEISGLNVSLRSPSLSYQGFNPTFFFPNVDITIPNHSVVPKAWASAESLLSLQNVRLQFKLFESLISLRPVINTLSVENLALAVNEGIQDGWQFKWKDFFGSENLEVAYFLDYLLKVSNLQIKDADVKFERFDKRSAMFQNISIVIRNSDDGGLMHLDAESPGFNQPIMMSFENPAYTEKGFSGEFHARLPKGDYTNFLNMLSLSDSLFDEMSITELVGGAELWLGLRDGYVSDGVLDYEFSKVVIDTNKVSELENLTALVLFDKNSSRGAAANWRVLFRDFSMQWEETSWPETNLWFSYHEGDSEANSQIDMSADYIDIERLVEFTNRNFSFDPVVQEQAINLSPRGILRNFTVQLSGIRDEDTSPSNALMLRIKTNLDDVSIDSAGAIPEVGGVTGFLSLDYDPKMQKFVGDASIESQNFRLGLPNTFSELWDYEYVNGEIGFTLDFSDKTSINILSNIVHLRSTNTAGKLKFRSRIIPSKEPNPVNDLELVVGVDLMDVKDRFLYLPNGPRISENLKRSMEWVGTALEEGVLADSGILYRGSTVKDTDPGLKTFQGFYRISDGVMRYDRDWPSVTNVNGFIITADDQTDIKIDTGRTSGLSLSDTVGTIRKITNSTEIQQGTSLLRIEGVANGETQSGLEFISTSPINFGFKNAIVDWDADGQFKSSIMVERPLGSSGSKVDVRAKVSISDNSLQSTKFPLQFDSLFGDVIFDTRYGVEKTELSGLISEEPVTFTLDSERRIDNVLSNITVSASGVLPSFKLRGMLGPTSSLGSLLTATEGDFKFDAVLSLPQNNIGREPSLELTSFLKGVSLNLPPPFGKSKADTLMTNVNFLFGSAQQAVSGKIGNAVTFDLNLAEGRFKNGVIGVGDTPEGLLSGLKNSTKGLAIVGHLERLRVEAWQRFFDDFSKNTLNSEQKIEDSMASLAQKFSFADLSVNDLNVYGEKFSNVNLHIEGDLDEMAWLIGLDSLGLKGNLAIPFDSNEYLTIDLGRIGFQKETNLSDRMFPDSNILTDRSDDRLALIDPRRLPKLKFSTRELFVGDKSFGNWKFTINPTETGAIFTDLVFNFRGLSLGEEIIPDIPPPRFDWSYDGYGHESHLFGTLRVDDIAEVLVENGFAPSLESSNGEFVTDIRWPGSPLYFSGDYLSGSIKTKIEDGRFLQGGGASGALKLISILNFDDFMRRLRFNGDLLRRGLAYESIEGDFVFEQGIVDIQEQLVISGPSSLYQIAGEVDLKNETIDGEMYLTLPVSENIPWVGLLTSNIPLAVGAYLFDRIFGDEVSSLTSAIYTLNGDWEGLEPQFKQAFGSLDDLDLNGSGAAVQ